jgi:signal transduction histidine kinase
MTRSIQSKLNAGLVLSLIIAFTALWLLVSINIQFLAKEYITSRLRHDTENLLNIISFDNNGQLKIDEARIDQIYNQPFSGHYYVINAGDQVFSSRSLWDYTLTVSKVNTGQHTRSEQTGPEHQPLLLFSGGYQKRGHELTITIAENLNPINRNITRFKYWFSGLASGMLLLLVIMQVIILRKSLSPIVSIQAQLKLLQQGKLDRLSTDTPGELRPLVDEINHLLVVTEQRLRRSRDALGDLAHAIKKPLTVIKQITDRDNIPDATRSTLIKQSDDIYRISDNILKRARLAGHSHTGSRFSFSDDLPALLKTLEVMHAGKNINLTANIQNNIICPVDREDMLELLGNLLDNAYKWANSGIVFSVYSNTDLNLCIEDDGPGVKPEEISDISKRGVRLDEKVHGHGFGLAICTDIVRDYGGNINFTRSSELGGFMTSIILPMQAGKYSD